MTCPSSVVGKFLVLHGAVTYNPTHLADKQKAGKFAMGAFYRIQTRHGTWLAAHSQSAEVVCCADEGAESQQRPLLGYISKLRPEVCFLIADSAGLGRLTMRPGLNCEALLPLGLAPNDSAQTVSLYHPDTGKWVCAAPLQNGGSFAPVTADRDVIRAYEEFTLVPMQSIFVSQEVTSLVGRLDQLLASPMSVDTILSQPQGDAALLQAVGRMMTRVQLGDLAQSLLESPNACRKLAELFPDDLFGTLGLPALADWVARRNTRATPILPTTGWLRRHLMFKPKPKAKEPPVSPPPGRITLGTELDRLAALGRDGQYVSFPHACTAIARRAVEPRRDVCIVATARNEGLYLLDWIAYHRALGVEAFFLYTNDNDDGSDDLLAALALAGVIHWADNKVATGGSAQHKAYSHALALRPEVLDYRWALIIDLDEYMVLNPKVFRSIPAYLRWQETDVVDAIGLNWIFHGSCGAANWRDDFIVRRFPNPVTAPNAHIKSLIRPRKFIHSLPHNPLTYRRQQFVFKNSSSNPHVPHAKIGPAWSETPVAEYAWINHYFYKSTEEFLLKWSRNRGDHARIDGPTNTVLTAQFVREFVTQFDKREEQRADPEIAAAGYERELSNLMNLPGVSEAFDLIKRTYVERMKIIIPMFLEAPAIVETGTVGEAFLNTLGLSRDRISRPAITEGDHASAVV
jgi:hypothetical protein